MRLQVIGGDVTPRGICGSGLIDVVAQLRLAGLLKENGVLVSSEDATLAGHPLAERIVDRDGIRAFALTDDVVLTQLDVRELQSAKGAIATGIEVAMHALGVEAAGLDEVLLAGSFGTYIHPRERARGRPRAAGRGRADPGDRQRGERRREDGTHVVPRARGRLRAAVVRRVPRALGARRTSTTASSATSRSRRSALVAPDRAPARGDA